MHSGGTHIERIEKFLKIPSAAVFVGDLVSVEIKEVLHLLSAVSFLSSFFSLKGGIIQCKYFQLYGFIFN